MKLTPHHLNAFTDTLLKGSHVGIICLDEWLSTKLMQAIATENNMPETTFVKQDERGIYHIRWFSSITEIDFFDHATLACAYNAI
jgi:PhzF family phenazine biosynthesis protein